MRLQLVILGWEIFNLSLSKDEPEEEAAEGIGGGSAHNFERYQEVYEGYVEPDERAFGFH